MPWKSKGHAKFYQGRIDVRHEGTKRFKSRCKLGWFQNDNILSPKSSYFNVKMEKIVKNQI
jgi:hypothetical protein